MYHLLFICTFSCSILFAQTFTFESSNPVQYNIIMDCIPLENGNYLGIETFGTRTPPLADSISIFLLSDKGQKLRSSTVHGDQNTKFSLYTRAIYSNESAHLLYSTYDLSISEKKGTILSIDTLFDINWIREGVGFAGNSEAFSISQVNGDTLQLYGFWTDDNLNSIPFFLFLDKNGDEIALDTIHGMYNKIKGGDTFVETNDYYFFFNTKNIYYKLAKQNYTIIDSFEIDLDTLFFSGYSLLTPNNTIFVSGYSDTIPDIQIPFAASTPAVIEIDSSGKYLRKFRHYGDLTRQTSVSWEGITLSNDSSAIFLVGYDSDLTDWLSLQKIDLNGKLLWARYYHLGKNFFSTKTRACPDGGVILSGYAHENGDWDGLVLKFDSLGYIDGLVNTENVKTNFGFSKIRCYPNPSSDVIHLEKQHDFPLSANIITQDGKTIKTIDWKERNLSISLGGIENGLYFLVLENEKGTKQAEKLIIQH